MPNMAATTRSLNQQLLEAAKNGENEEVCRLASLEDERGSGVVDVNTRDKRGYTVLHYFSTRDESLPDDADTISFILDQGATVDGRNHEGCTPLHYASKNGLVDTASLLIEKGNAHVNCKNVFEWTPLMYCAEHNQAKVACLLLGKGASVNAKNRAGCTPLHYASMAGHVSIVHLLLGMGADVHVKRKDGKTPLQLAKNGETARVLGGSSLQAALHQSPVAPLEYTDASTGSKATSGTFVVDKRLETLVQKQEFITASLQDQVQRLELILDESINPNDNDSEQENNIKPPVPSVTIRGGGSGKKKKHKNSNGHNKGRASPAKPKKKTPQQQQQHHHQRANKLSPGRYYSTTILPQMKHSSYNESDVLVPIGTTNAGGKSSVVNTSSTRFSPPPKQQQQQSNSHDHHHPLTELIIPPRTSTATVTSPKTNQTNSSTKPATPLDGGRFQRSGLLDKVALYEAAGGGASTLRRSDERHQQHVSSTNNNNSRKANYFKAC